MPEGQGLKADRAFGTQGYWGGQSLDKAEGAIPDSSPSLQSWMCGLWIPTLFSGLTWLRDGTQPLLSLPAMPPASHTA